MMTTDYVSWPPPGLERLQGSASPLVRSLGIGALLMALPLLWSIGSDVPYWGFGPFGINWWAVPLLTGIGLVFVLVGLGRLFVTLRAAWLNARMGHGLLTVAQVVADTTRDTGFLIQGARHYASLDEKKRASLMLLRLSRTGLSVAGALWMLFGLFLAVLLAARGVLSPRGMWVLTFAPAAVVLVAALYCRAQEMDTVRRARNASREAAETDLAVQMSDWEAAYEALAPAGLLGRGTSGATRPISWGAIGLGVFTLLLFLTMSGILVVSAGGPLAADVSIPRFQGVQDRAVIAEVMRPWRLPSDPAITVEQAGQSLNVFLKDQGRDVDYLRPPVRTYTEWPDRGFHMRRALEMFPEAARRRLSRADRTYVEKYADPPPAAEFRVLARAGSADFTGGRYRTPLPADLTGLEMIIPRFQGMSDVARAQVATALRQLDDGDRGGSETTLREVLSTGLLMLDEGTNLITNLVGIVIVGVASDGLEAFYAATGDQRTADRIHELREGARHAGSASSMRRLIDTQSAVREMAEMAHDPASMRGLRWEFVQLVAGIAPCMNLHGALHGPGMEYEEWLAETRASLVRYPSEDALFDVYARGADLGLIMRQEDEGFLWRLFSLAQRILGIPGGCSM